MYYWNAKKTNKTEPVREEVKQEQLILMGPSSDHSPDAGVEQEENKIYFYSQVTEKDVLELNKIIKRLDKEMQVLGITLNIPPPPIELHIHSEGGSLFAGIAAYDCIKTCKAPVHTYIDGCAASAATLLFLAGSRRNLYKNSFMLVHQLSATLLGSKYEEFKDELKNQEKLMHTVKNIYLETGKLSDEDLTELMKHDLWMDSETIMKNGFADIII